MFIVISILVLAIEDLVEAFTLCGRDKQTSPQVNLIFVGQLIASPYRLLLKGVESWEEEIELEWKSQIEV
ncbi:hypothetical protein K6U49_02600 [Vibrio alginolyticus]|uniref:hypothetical protein n=1 Tax=Vibrio alginolyticus TaxID=663 RepID=UPI001EEC02CF|nr:hypothetical protein [Vibrio alginolyticus]MCG6307511.1 hypothetical protein [Vibrio alginolyticus]